MAEKYRLYYDSTGENKFLFHLSRGKIRYFTKCEMGILYYDLAAGETVLLNTVDFSISKYSERNYTMALLSQKLQYKISLPIYRHLVKL